MSQSTKLISQKVANLQEDINDGNKKVSLLEERMAEINGSNMRQQGMLEALLQKVEIISIRQQTNNMGNILDSDKL